MVDAVMLTHIVFQQNNKINSDFAPLSGVCFFRQDNLFQ